MTNQFGLISSLNQRCCSCFIPNNVFPGFDVFVSGGKLIREVPEGKGKKKLKLRHEWNRWISMSVGRGWALWYKAKHIQYQRRNSTTLGNVHKSFLRILISKDFPRNVPFPPGFLWFPGDTERWPDLGTPGSECSVWHVKGRRAHLEGGPWGRAYMLGVTKCIWSSSLCSWVWIGFGWACFGT